MSDTKTHGKASTYTNHACRCEACTRAATERMRKFRAANPSVREYDILNSKAAAKAISTLKKRYANEYRKLLNAERKKLGL